jgi:hypothetical protein
MRLGRTNLKLSGIGGDHPVERSPGYGRMVTQLKRKAKEMGAAQKAAPIARRYGASEAGLSSRAEFGGNCVERGVQARADQTNRGDDGDADESGNQAVLNRRGAVFIFQKTLQREHVRSTPNKRHIAPKALKVSGNK